MCASVILSVAKIKLRKQQSRSHLRSHDRSDRRDAEDRRQDCDSEVECGTHRYSGAMADGLEKFDPQHVTEINAEGVRSKSIESLCARDWSKAGEHQAQARKCFEHCVAAAVFE